MVKNIYFSLFTSLQSNSDPFLLRSSGDDCEQSSEPIQIPSVSGKSWNHLLSFELYFITFNCHFESLRGRFLKTRTSRLARVSCTDIRQSTLFYTWVTPGGTTVSKIVVPTAQPKIHLNFKKMQLFDYKFWYPRGLTMFIWTMHAGTKQKRW